MDQFKAPWRLFRSHKTDPDVRGTHIAGWVIAALTGVLVVPVICSSEKASAPTPPTALLAPTFMGHFDRQRENEYWMMSWVLDENDSIKGHYYYVCDTTPRQCEIAITGRCSWDERHKVFRVHVHGKRLTQKDSADEEFEGIFLPDGAIAGEWSSKLVVPNQQHFKMALLPKADIPTVALHKNAPPQEPLALLRTVLPHRTRARVRF